MNGKWSYQNQNSFLVGYDTIHYKVLYWKRFLLVSVPNPSQILKQQDKLLGGDLCFLSSSHTGNREILFFSFLADPSLAEVKNK